MALPLALAACGRFGTPSPAVMHQCLGVTEPFASADLAVPLSVLTKGMAATGSLSWHRHGPSAWTARWTWRDDDIGQRHRTTFAINEIAQDAATDACGPHVATISRMTIDGEDVSPMTRDQTVYEMRDRYAADQGVTLGKAKPPPVVPGAFPSVWDRVARQQKIDKAVHDKAEADQAAQAKADLIQGLLNAGNPAAANALRDSH